MLGLAVLLMTLSVLTVAHAQAAQSNYSLNLSYFTVQFTYPSQVNPGDSITVNLQAVAKNSLSSASLTAQIFYPTGNSLRQVASATVSNNAYMKNGASLTKQITFTVPQDAPRTSLIASVTETVQTASSSYYYDNSYPYCYDYSSYYYYGYCDYGYPYSYSYYSYPTYSYTSTTDSGVAPLSYVKATTPEYTALQTQYQSEQQQLNQSQAQNQELQQQLQNAQNTLSQRDATIANLNQQLSSNQNTNITLEAAAAGLVILTLLFAAFAVHFRRATKQQQPRIQQNQQPGTSASQGQRQLNLLWTKSELN